MLEEKLNQLKTQIRSLDSCVVAYSGGVDSVFLAVVAHEVLGAKAVAVIADSPSLPRHELAEAKALASQHGFALRVIQTQEFSDEAYRSNPVNRCYFCKSALFQELVPFARENGFAVILYGENASDVGDHRPGRIAAEEFAVRAPLREVGLTKAEIRSLSRELGLATADKPAQPCLSSRIPYGEVVSEEKLKLIEAGEGVLREFGFREFRVRLHEVTGGYLARLEIADEEMARAAEPEQQGRLAAALKGLGFAYVVLDLQGYRRGSLGAGLVTVSEAPESSAESAVRG